MMAQALIAGFSGLLFGFLLAVFFAKRSSNLAREISSAKEVELAALSQNLKKENFTAESFQQTKSAFLANMNHELRTPLNAIIGYSEMLMEAATERDQGASISDLQKIHSAGKNLLHSINDILELSDIESGKTATHLEKFDLQTMIRDVADDVQFLVLKNQNRLEIEIQPDLKEFHSDFKKIRKILFNLLSNASKFTERGLIRLCVASEYVNGTNHLKFTISDSGIGIAPEQIGRLFEAFTQADESPTRKYGGTGLGLAISRNFCRSLGGEIHVESVVGKGSLFTVTLPFEPPQT